MSAKRYEWMACDEHSCHCDVVESAEGDMVDYEDYAELEARYAALAAENAGLKAAIEYCINPDNQPEYHDHGMGCGVEDHGYQRDGYSACYYGWESAMERVYSEVIPDAIPETPATDAFLAEVRAQVAEEALKIIGNFTSDECGDGVYIAIKEFAEHLRKGVQS